MADCYIVRRGGTGGGEKGIIDLTDKDCLLNMLETWFFAEGTGVVTNGYVVLPSGIFYGSYSSNKQLKVEAKYNYPTALNFLVDTRLTATSSTSSNITEYDFNNPTGIMGNSYTTVTSIFNNGEAYISEDVECKCPEVKKHFGTWCDYKNLNLRFIDVVKLPPKMNDDVFTDFVIFEHYEDTSSSYHYPVIWGINNVKELYIDRANKKLCFRAEYCYGWTYSTNDYDPSMSKDRENRDDDLHSDGFSVSEIVNYIAYTTYDILYEDGTIAMKANCTLDEVIQKE